MTKSCRKSTQNSNTNRTNSSNKERTSLRPPRVMEVGPVKEVKEMSRLISCFVIFWLIFSAGTNSGVLSRELSQKLDG